MSAAKKRAGMRTTARLVPGLTRAAFAARGFHRAAVITDWQAIVGDALAGRCVPERLSTDGVLTIRASGSVALALQHLEPQMLERIAGYFGFRAVTRLRFRQAPLPQPKATERPRESPPPPSSLAAVLADIEDDALRTALLRLGAEVAAKD
jgi:hypothetical protein|tara:strand:+ start:148 stop:600 length:453 start_codon:yes stop_codon:yes gene_type:complete